eukprot:2549287-Pleurochrysis_carterae.AAC.1
MVTGCVAGKLSWSNAADLEHCARGLGHVHCGSSCDCVHSALCRVRMPFVSTASARFDICPLCFSLLRSWHLRGPPCVPYLACIAPVVDHASVVRHQPMA